MKILSSFTYPQVVPNLYECVCSAEHKGRYSEECGKQSSSGAPLTSIVYIFFLTMEVNGAPKQPDYKLSSKYLPLCSAEKKIKIIQVWNYLRLSKWWRNFHFWVNYLFKFKHFTLLRFGGAVCAVKKQAEAKLSMNFAFSRKKNSILQSSQ